MKRRLFSTSAAAASVHIKSSLRTVQRLYGEPDIAEDKESVDKNARKGIRNKHNKRIITHESSVFFFRLAKPFFLRLVNYKFSCSFFIFFTSIIIIFTAKTGISLRSASPWGGKLQK